jgi:phosphate/sulfate permease
MARTDKPILLNTSNPSRNFLTVAVVLAVFVLFLISFSVALALNYFDPSKQFFIFALLVSIPLIGLLAAVVFIYRHSQRLFASSRNEENFSRVMPPESQRRKLNSGVKELAKVMNVAEENLGDLRAAYILAEDLALRKIEQEKKQPLKRHIKVGDAEFDAVFISSAALTFVEVAFLVTPNFSQEKIDHILDKLAKVKKSFFHIRKNSKFKLMLAIVTQLDVAGESDLRSSLAMQFEETPVDVDIRFLDFEELQRIFTEE